MKIKKILFTTALSVAVLSACSSGDNNDDNVVEDLLSEGTNITLRNTLEEGGIEVSYPSLFGQMDDAFDEMGTLSYSEAEFPTALAQPDVAGGISGLYEIDLNANSIDFTLLPAADDPFWVNVFEVFPAGKFDRYYLTFSEPHNITSGTSSNSSVSLRIDSNTVVVVQIAEGYDMNPPMSFNISLE